MIYIYIFQKKTDIYIYIYVVVHANVPIYEMCFCVMVAGLTITAYFLCLLAFIFWIRGTKHIFS